MDGGTCQATVHVIEELDTTEQVSTIHVKSQLKTLQNKKKKILCTDA